MAGSFAFADIVLIKALGIGVAIAVALDATVVRALLVPSTMRLLGLELVDAPSARPVRRPSGSRRGGRGRGGGRPMRHHRPRRAGSGAALQPSSCSWRLAGCGRPILANAGRTPAARAPPRGDRRAALDPLPVELPARRRPHDRLTEWWYYTGHLRTAADGARDSASSSSSSVPSAATSRSPGHRTCAITDEAGGRFLYDQRSEVGRGSSAPRPDGQPCGFDLG